MAKGLTDLQVKNLRPKAGADGKPVRTEIPDPGSRGLYVVVQENGRHGFAVRYRCGGKSRKLTLPRNITLAVAQDKAAQEQADTLEAVAESYLKREGSKLRTFKARRSMFTRLVYPVLGSKPIGDIKRSDVVRLLDKIEDEQGARMADCVLMA